MRKLRLREGESLAQSRPADHRRPHLHIGGAASSRPRGLQRELLTWVVGKVLRLASFSFPVDDIEVHLHRSPNVLVPILRNLNKKHVLKESCQQFNCNRK